MRFASRLCGAAAGVLSVACRTRRGRSGRYHRFTAACNNVNTDSRPSILAPAAYRSVRRRSACESSFCCIRRCPSGNAGPGKAGPRKAPTLIRPAPSDARHLQTPGTSHNARAVHQLRCLPCANVRMWKCQRSEVPETQRDVDAKRQQTRRAGETKSRCTPEHRGTPASSDRSTGETSTGRSAIRMRSLRRSRRFPLHSGCRT